MIELSPIVSVRCMVVDPYDRLLVIERPTNGEQPGMLQLPGGKVEAIDGLPGRRTLFERLVQAAERETEEETGLQVASFGCPELMSSYVIPDGKHAGRLLSSYVVLGEVVGGTMGTGVDQHPASWWLRSIVTGLGADHFTDVTRQAAALTPTPTIDAYAPIALAA